MILEIDLEQYTRLQDDGCPNCPEQIAGIVITYPSGWQYHTGMTAVLVDLPITHQDFSFTTTEVEVVRRAWREIDEFIIRITSPGGRRG